MSDETVGIIATVAAFAWVPFWLWLRHRGPALQERAERAERERDEFRELLLDKGMKVGTAETSRLGAENQALQEALAFYANERNYEWRQMKDGDGERYTSASSLVDEDSGERARHALSPTQETDPDGDLGAYLRARYGTQETDPE